MTCFIPSLTPYQKCNAMTQTYIFSFSKWMVLIYHMHHIWGSLAASITRVRKCVYPVAQNFSISSLEEHGQVIPWVSPGSLDKIINHSYISPSSPLGDEDIPRMDVVPRQEETGYLVGAWHGDTVISKRAFHRGLWPLIPSPPVPQDLVWCLRILFGWRQAGQ